MEGLQSISTRTCVTCFTAPVLHSTSVVNKPCFLIARSQSLSSLVMKIRGFKLLSASLRTALVFPSRKTSARRGRASAPKHRLTVRKVRACGLASYNYETLSTNVQELQSRAKTRKRRKHQRLRMLTRTPTHPPILYTPVYIFLLQLRHTGTTRASPTDLIAAS